eukprot:TRINITY_DN4339_c0_g1_i1.p1 TRINITY_DN4339_c0_g1~~TRINITY_DN4339_c0_g1_i1.p1  ORF type:complete len:401 (-),score=66.48 TRINITY_DN4339_c0_g1_i1:349-1551(-)
MVHDRGLAIARTRGFMPPGYPLGQECSDKGIPSTRTQALLAADELLTRLVAGTNRCDIGEGDNANENEDEDVARSKVGSLEIVASKQPGLLQPQMPRVKTEIHQNDDPSGLCSGGRTPTCDIMEEKPCTQTVRRRGDRGAQLHQSRGNDKLHVSPSASVETSPTNFHSRLSFRIPLSDHYLSIRAANAVISSAQSREKFLKIFQYIAKLMAYVLTHFIARGPVLISVTKRAEVLAKNLSLARRFFKFFRWLKHFDDMSLARSESNLMFACLLCTSIVCNLVADVAEDICSLERVGVFEKGSLPSSAEYHANVCQLVLAMVEIVVSACKAWRLRRRTVDRETLSDQRKRIMANLEFSKFVTDLGKAFWDCEFSFASELLFCVCGLWAALVSTHKFMLRALR